MTSKILATVVATVPRGAPRPLTVRWRDVAIEVAGGLPAVERELRTRLEPFFTVTSSTARSDATAVIRVGVGRIAKPADPGEIVLLRRSSAVTRYRRPASVHRDGDAILVRDMRDDVVFGFRCHDRTLTMVGPDVATLASGCRRVIQDLVRLEAWRRGAVVVEGSAVGWDGRALVAVGGPGAGKTTLATRLLAVESPPGFLANDEVMIVPRPSGVVVSGAPVHVMVRPDLAAAHSELSDVAASLSASGDAKQSMHYATFARRFGAEVLPTADLGVLVFLRAGSGMAPLGRDAVRHGLAEAALWTDTWTTPWRWLGPPADDVALVRRALDEAATRVSAYELGRDTEPQTVRGLFGREP